MKFCLPFLTGVVAGWVYPVPLVYPALLFVFLSLLYILVARRGPLQGYSAINFFCLVAVAGTIKIIYDCGRTETRDVARYVRTDRRCLIEGKVSDLPVLSDGMMKFGIATRRIVVADSVAEVGGDVQVSLLRDLVSPGMLESLSYGKAVWVAGTISAPPPRRNPGDFDMKYFFRLNGISARFLADTFVVGRGKAGGSFTASCVYPVRHAASVALDSMVGGDEGNFLKGLLLGERSTIPLDLKNEFINAGVMHILAVSGLHVAIVAMILLILFRIIRIPEKPATVMTILVLCYYNFLTGSAASVTRSVVMASVFLLGKLLERKTDIYNTLAVSAIVIVAFDAKQFFQAGFQLSFVAVFSLVYLYPRMSRMDVIFPSKIRTMAITRGFVAALSVSLAAGVGTLPFTALYFGKISVISFVANLVAVPLSNVILAVGMLSVALWFVIPWVGLIYGAATKVLTVVFLWIVAVFGKLPFAYYPVRFSVWSSLLFYTIVGLIVGIQKKGVGKYCLIGLLSVSTLIVWWPLVVPSPGVLRITLLDVGEGDAICAEFPGGTTVLVDCGPKTSVTDAGARYVEPFLRWKGKRSCDAVFLTHPHSDHIGGVPYLLRNISVGVLYSSGLPPQNGLDSEYQRIADSLPVRREILRQGEIVRFGAAVRVYILYPDDGIRASVAGRGVNLNNQSVVLKVVYGKSSILLVGDAEEDVEQRLIRRYGSFLRSDILKAGHHGSNTSSSQAFLEGVQPSVALVSVGINNKFQHPSPDVLRRYTLKGCRYFRTDEGGAVVFESDGDRWEVVDWK